MHDRGGGRTSSDERAARKKTLEKGNREGVKIWTRVTTNVLLLWGGRFIKCIIFDLYFRSAGDLSYNPSYGGLSWSESRLGVVGAQHADGTACQSPTTTTSTVSRRSRVGRPALTRTPPSISLEEEPLVRRAELGQTNRGRGCGAGSHRQLRSVSLLSGTSHQTNGTSARVVRQ